MSLTRGPWTLSLWVAAGLLAAVFLIVTVVPLLPGYSPYAQDLFSGLVPPWTGQDDKFYLLGTDTLGRDLLSRLALAGRVSLFIATSAVAISLVIGVTLGLVAGFYSGKIDLVVMAVADIQISIPRILLLIAIAALAGTNIYELALVLGLTGWVSYCRLARALALSLRSREFVLSATSQGASTLRNLVRHVLPHVMQPMIVLAAFDLGQVIVLEASLSYIGLGVQPPTPSWGGMIAEGQDYLQSNPAMALVPGFAIFMLVAGVQFVSQSFSQEGRRTVTLLSRR